ncbi:hypothetical protein [Marinoscillum sp.]|uniref:hypothetical protein n=1 Tax=Marinoscillum sp. TaxID=2024838 RepID=UPI003BA99EA0
MQKIVYALLIAFSLSGCFFNEITDSETVVLLEDVIYISSNDIRLLGRLYSLEGTASDHGFEFSEDESFSAPQVVSLGEKKTVGLFFSEFNLLEEKTDYYYRAYVTSGNNKFYSDIRSISTFEGSVTRASSLYGESGDQIEIIGTNFTTEMSILFGETTAVIKSRLGGYKLKVEVPAPQTDYRVPVYANFDGRKVLVDTFEYKTGNWVKLSAFPINRMTNAAVKTDGNSAFIYLGAFSETQKNDSIYNYDFTANAWGTPTALTSEEYFAEGAFYTPNGLFGAGATQIRETFSGFQYTLTDRFGKLESDGTITDLGFTPAMGVKPLAFYVNQDLIVLGGINSGETIWRYTDGEWSYLGKLPFAITASTPNTYYNGAIYLFHTEDNTVWKYDLSTLEFSKFTELSMNVQSGAAYFQRGKYLIFGLFPFQSAIYQLNLETGEVLTKNNFEGQASYSTDIQFDGDGNLFVIRGASSTESTEFWKFEPFTFKQ